MSNSDQGKTDRHILWAIVLIVVMIILKYAYEDHINYVIQKEKFQLMKQELSSDHVKGLINSKK